MVIFNTKECQQAQRRIEYPKETKRCQSTHYSQNTLKLALRNVKQHQRPHVPNGYDVNC